MKYVIQTIPASEDKTIRQLRVAVFSEAAIHEDYAIPCQGKYGSAQVVGAGYCYLLPHGRVATHGKSTTLNKAPHPADSTVLATFCAGELEQQSLLMADLYRR